MPSRKRGNLGARSPGAQRLRQVRETETEEQRHRRLNLQRVRQCVARSSETVDQREARLRYQRHVQSSSRATETAAQRTKRLQADRERHARLRGSETPEQRERRLVADRERQARRRCHETPEDRERRLTANRKRNCRTRGCQLEDVPGRLTCSASGRKRRRRVKDPRDAAHRKHLLALARENNKIQKVLKRWMTKVKKQLNTVCSGPLESCLQETFCVKMEPIDFNEELSSVSYETADSSEGCSRSVEGGAEVCPSLVTTLEAAMDQLLHQVTVKTEVPDEDDGPMGEVFTVDDVALPKTEPRDEEAAALEVNGATLPDQVPKPLELFVNVSTECGLVSRGAEVNPKMESDPLDVGVESKTSVGGAVVGKRVGSMSQCAVVRDVVASNGVKLEVGVSSVDDSSARELCGTSSPAQSVDVMPRRRRAVAPPVDDEKALLRIEKRRAAQREYQRGRRSNLRPSQQRALREKHRLYRRRLRAAHRLAASAGTQNEVQVLDSD